MHVLVHGQLARVVLCAADGGGLSDCPSDLSEAQYAHLLYESICSGCGKIGRRLLFNLRVRFCALCYKANVETYTIIDGVEDYRDALLPFVPCNSLLTEANWSCDAAFRLHKLGGGPVHCDNEPHAAPDDVRPSMTEAVVLLEMTLPASFASLHPQDAPARLKDDDPCCRLCADACYMQVDMRSEDAAKRHMQDKHGKAEVLEADLCPTRDVFSAAQEYADAHGVQVIVTRMRALGG